MEVLLLVPLSLIVILFASRPENGLRLSVGDTWRIDKVWSGQGIADAARKDGGSYYIRIDAELPNGSFVVDGKEMTCAEFRKSYLGRQLAHRSRPEGLYQQRLETFSTFVGKTEQVPPMRPDPLSEKTREILGAGGITALAEYLNYELEGRDEE